MRSRARAEGLSRGILLILLFPLLTIGQPGQDYQKQIDDLKLRIRQLERENQMLRSERRTADSILYCSIRIEIFEAFTKVQQMEFDFESTTDRIAVTGLFAKLMQANNPASDVLGFRFTDLVLKAAEKHFIKNLKNEKDKNRFSDAILTILNNPFVSALAGSNPLTSVVSSIISTVIGFTTSRVIIDKDGGKIKDVEVDQENAFESEYIVGFKEDLQDYINFYDHLIEATEKYLSGLYYLKSKYANLMCSVSGYKAEIHSFLGPGEDNFLISLTLLLPEPVTGNIEYETLLKHPAIQKCLMNARKFPFLEQSVSDFKQEHNHLLFDFLTSYINILKTTADFPDTAIEKSRTESLILEIEHFIKDQKLVQENPYNTSNN